MITLVRLTLLLLFAWAGRAEAVAGWTEFPVPEGSGPHDVAPAPDGMVWFTAQAAGALGRLDPRSGHVDEFPLGDGSAPHGVIVGPDGAPWVTDGGLNAILRVDPASHAIRSFPLPAKRAGANLNTATFDQSGALWFTGQAGIYGRVDAGSGAVRVWDAPRGPVPMAPRPPAWSILCHWRAVTSRIQSRDRRGDGDRAADAATGRSTDLVRFAGRAVDQRVPRRSDCSFRPRQEHVAILASAWR
jgi:hypothetical protein